jgi:hypothetical protein
MVPLFASLTLAVTVNWLPTDRGILVTLEVKLTFETTTSLTAFADYLI